jgi:hypothetical protein
MKDEKDEIDLKTRIWLEREKRKIRRMEWGEFFGFCLFVLLLYAILWIGIMKGW